MDRTTQGRTTRKLVTRYKWQERLSNRTTKIGNCEMNPRVIKVEPKDEYKLLLEFENGELKIYDMRQHLDFGIFNELKDVKYFKQVKVIFGTVAWPNEQDICPDTLYLGASTLS